MMSWSSPTRNSLTTSHVWCTSIGFPDSYVHRILYFEKIDFKGQLYSHEHQQSFRTEGSWAKLERNTGDKHTFDLKIDGVSVLSGSKIWHVNSLKRWDSVSLNPSKVTAYIISPNPLNTIQPDKRFFLLSG